MGCRNWAVSRAFSQVVSSFLRAFWRGNENTFLSAEQKKNPAFRLRLPPREPELGGTRETIWVENTDKLPPHVSVFAFTEISPALSQK